MHQSEKKIPNLVSNHPHILFQIIEDKFIYKKKKKTILLR